MSDNALIVFVVLALTFMVTVAGIGDAISDRACPSPFEGRSQPFP